MNTEEQIDALFNEIIQNENSIIPKSFEYNSLIRIRKIKLQLYFKKKLAEFLKGGIIKYSSSKNTYSKTYNNHNANFYVLDISKIENLNILEIADMIKRKPRKIMRLLIQNSIFIQSFHDHLHISDLKKIYPALNQIYQKQFQLPKTKLSSNKVVIAKEVDLCINDVCNKSIKDVSTYLSHPSQYIIKKLSDYFSISDINENFILTSETVKLLYGYLNNLFHIKNRKKLKGESLNIEWASKRKSEKFKPSLGKEGNYRKLIYIRTKS
ncbi:MAG: hypothetical protein NC410_10435 [Oscillibacter sp.]|nr:hypothetical protein [Oscillibacter sp.]